MKKPPVGTAQLLKRLSQREQIDSLHNRLENWKFQQATRYLKGIRGEDRDLVEALSRMFGDVGWFEGDMGIIIEAALSHIQYGKRLLTVRKLGTLRGTVKFMSPDFDETE